MKLKRILAAAVAVLSLCAALSGCSKKDPEPAETTVITEAGSDNAQIDVDDIGNEEATWADTTDVENEADRAIYKAQITELPDGWVLNENSDQGKAYSSALGGLYIQATNFGADAELRPLPEFADSVAANIKMTNMFSQADTEFGEPVETTVAGLPAIKYDYTVTAYIYTEFDDEGKALPESKQIYAEFIDRIYIFYNNTDAYVIRFETAKENIDIVQPDFDKMLSSFVISEDGQKGYEEASAFMSENSIEPFYTDSSDAAQ